MFSDFHMEIKRDKEILIEYWKSRKGSHYGHIYGHTYIGTYLKAKLWTHSLNEMRGIKKWRDSQFQFAGKQTHADGGKQIFSALEKEKLNSKIKLKMRNWLLRQDLESLSKPFYKDISPATDISSNPFFFFFKEPSDENSQPLYFTVLHWHCLTWWTERMRGCNLAASALVCISVGS